MYLKGLRGLSKLVISRLIIRVTPFLITLHITYLLSPLPFQASVFGGLNVGVEGLGFRV